MRGVKTTLVVLALLTMLLPAGWSQETPRMTVDDLYVYYFDQKHPDLAKLPDSVLGRAEKLKMAGYDPAIIRQAADVQKRYRDSTTYTVAQADSLPSLGKPKGPMLPIIWGEPMAGLKVRDSYQASNLGKDVDDFDSAKPATFSFANNFLDHSAVWTAQGAVLRPFTFERPAWAESAIEAIYLVPSVAFNRVSGGPVDKQVNSLVFRAGADFESRGVCLTQSPDDRTATFLMLNVRPNFAYATDFSFQSAVFAGELDLEPTIGDAGFGHYQSIGKDGWVQYRLRAFGHLEGGGVANAGEITSLRDNQTIFRAGFFAQAELRPNPKAPALRDSFVKNFSVLGRYELYPSMTNAPTVSLLTTSLSYKLGEYFSLVFQYQNGRLPLSAERIDLFTVGLGAKL